ncbi:MAG: DUF2782 domain-containing protein [Methylophilaceae bacterium]|uniref:DUF2782 domain-containing protein n=1 Tax=Methylovorus sp. MM2 TaxID=1848038 RepID=UPI0007DE8DAE|nr:DUF2782 domain-containing protein [Methylovorus sp. MM2]OAM51639.1 hypothetical protein A7981_09205 [Methylovorus sp. MM2]
MRLIRHTLFVLLALPVLAMAAGQPADLEPIPEAPPPPSGFDGGDPAAEPKVTIIKKGTDTIEEYRVNGELYMMKVTPAHGVPYYLTKEDQNSGWARNEGPSAPLSVPKWVLFNF